jgi:hypothetical protein
MKILMRVVLTSLLAVLGFGCAGQRGQQPRIERINPADLKPLPVQHEQLTDKQLRRARKLHETFAEVNPSSLETWIDNFKRDMNPDREIAIWERIAKGYTNYTSQKELSLEAKEDAFQTLLMCSMSSDEETIQALNLKVLSKDEARKICREY